MYVRTVGMANEREDARNIGAPGGIEPDASVSLAGSLIRSRAMPSSQWARRLVPLAVVPITVALFVLLDSPHAARAGEYSTGTLEPDAPMSAPRAAHTAAALPDGRVLVAGGFTDEGSAARSAEVYDPRTGRYAPLPRMVVPRHSHTATVLPDGKVLVAGGYGSGNEVVTSAELFDPATGGFMRTGSGSEGDVKAQAAAPNAGKAKSLVLAMVPMLSLAVVALWGLRRRYYLQHLVFSLHAMAYLLIVMVAMNALLSALASALRATGTTFSEGLVDAASTAALLGLFAWWSARAANEVYGGPRAANAARAVLLAVALAVVVQAYRFLLFLVTFHSI